jgi:hypothetical protein
MRSDEFLIVNNLHKFEGLKGKARALFGYGMALSRESFYREAREERPQRAQWGAQQLCREFGISFAIFAVCGSDAVETCEDV